MPHFEIVPLELWAVLALLVVAGLAYRWRQRRKRADRRTRAAQRHRRNVAHQRAWQWVFGHVGRPRPPRLEDLRERAED